MSTQHREELYSTDGDYGLRSLTEPDKPTADIVFVHGLTGNRESTWTHKASQTFWPQDLLPKDLPNVRIFTFGYDADIVRALDTASSETLRDHGKALAHDLALIRRRTRSETRPLIFVAHSLGGLVVEQALLISRGAAQQYLKDILRSTYGIMFMGTPHMGSSKANWAGPLTRLSSVVRTTNKKIVDVLEPGSEMLVNLQQEFHTMLEDRNRNERKNIEIFCFFEVLPVTLVGFIVDQPSAVLSSYPNRGIHANHMNMTKFSGPNDGGYASVSGQLWIWVDTIEKEEEERAASASAQPSAEVRDQRNQRFGQAEEITGRILTSGTFNSNGGTMFVGNSISGQDFNIGRR